MTQTSLSSPWHQHTSEICGKPLTLCHFETLHYSFFRYPCSVKQASKDKWIDGIIKLLLSWPWRRIYQLRIKKDRRVVKVQILLLSGSDTALPEWFQGLLSTLEFRSSCCVAGRIQRQQPVFCHINQENMFHIKGKFSDEKRFFFRVLESYFIYKQFFSILLFLKNSVFLLSFFRNLFFYHKHVYLNFFLSVLITHTILLS
jgi:hypothetical protein